MDFVPCNRKENCFSYFAIFILLGGIYCVYCMYTVPCVLVSRTDHIEYLYIYLSYMCHSNETTKSIIIIWGKKPFHFNYVLKERSHNHGSNFKVLSFCVYVQK